MQWIGRLEWRLIDTEKVLSELLRTTAVCTGSLRTGSCDRQNYRGVFIALRNSYPGVSVDSMPDGI